MAEYAVIHLEKHTGEGRTALDRHIDRKHTPDNADPLRADSNKYAYLAGEGPNRKLRTRPLRDKPADSITSLVDKRIADGYKGSKAIRKDAVRRLDIILTGSHDTMRTIGGDNRLNYWIYANYKFLAKKYGESNIVSFVVHMDETTPHVHATVVPLTPDGRLSAKEVVGDKNKLSKLQDDYAEAMKPFLMERGVRNSHARHTNVQEYYRRVNAADDAVTAAVAAAIGQPPATDVPLPPAELLGRSKREEYQRQQQQRQQQQVAAIAAEYAKKMREKEYANLMLKQENERLKSPKKAAISAPLASKLNQQKTIRQQPAKSRGIRR